jgi:predicted enzyme related to lactoylglutathione lyase
MVNSHGRFVWYVLMTTDMEAAAAFYSKVVGWGTRDASTPGRRYTVFTAGEASISAVMNLPKSAGTMDERPGWIGYVSVDDVDVTTDRIKRLGGAVHVPPQDILDVSRFSVVADEQMATLALFEWLRPDDQEQPIDLQQPIDLRARGRVGWHELYAADREKAWAFYSRLFGWQKADADIDAMGPSQLFSAGGQTIGGIYTKGPAVPVPFWLYYFNVGDIDVAVRRVKAGGGHILKGPTEVPGGNWIVQCTDPQGAIFALVGQGTFGYFEPAAPAPSTKRSP